MRIVGAGLGRTGTASLKAALERLLDAPCYHMFEVFANPDHLPVWHEAIRGNPPEWREFLSGYAASVDWPAAIYYRELAELYPDATVLLSTRDVDVWWRSANRTIFDSMRRGARDDPVSQSFFPMTTEMLQSTFSPSLDDEEACKAAYELHNQQVRDTIPHERLLEWHPGDGWEPICAALDLAVPDEPFPHANSTAEFLEIRRALDGQDTPP